MRENHFTIGLYSASDIRDKERMAEGLSVAERLLDVIGWVVGVAIAGIVAVALISHAFVIPAVPDIVSSIVGWSIIVLTLLGVILAFATHSSATA